MKTVNGTIPGTYEVLENRFSGDLNSAVMLLKHKKTGARVALISNDDENKVFYIGFRTPVENSTGVPHILEHSVLCGSEHFPIHDPFVELAKGSLNTFLNAMTFPDKTVYPVASCNDKDFQNLMHVYLDAVFHPNIYRHPEIFKQEGWHYELKDRDSDLELNGVVYSEMKGAFSSADDVMERQIMNTLFPDITYGVESGGDPDVIPTLSYEEFLDFHRRYYHPTNSYIFLYGNMDMGEKLEFIDREYLSNYDYQPVDSEIRIQKSFDQPVEREILLPVTDEEEEENGAFLSYNVVVGESVDKELYTAIKILDYAICSAPGAPLKTELIKKGIGKDAYSSYENGIRQQYFSIFSRDAQVSQKEEFLSTIRGCLEAIVKNGFEEKALKAAISRMEFQYREADFGSYPKGLVYGLQILDSWLYDDSKVFWHVEADATFRSLKEKIKTGYFENLVKTYLLDNPHCAIVTGIPKAGLNLKKEEELKQKLKAYKESLSEEEVLKLVEDTKNLKIYQETPDSEEDLATIPLLSREDLRKEILPLYNRMEEVDGSRVLYHDVFTSGIAYICLSFDANHLPVRLYPYLTLMKSAMGLLDTKSYSYKDLVHETDLYTGMISSEVGLNLEYDTRKTTIFFEMRCKVLYENVAKAFELMKEILYTSKFEDTVRLLEIIKEFRSKLEASAVSVGHGIALVRMNSYFNESGAISEKLNGIDFLRFLQDLDDHFEEKKEEAVAGLKEVAGFLLRPENLLLDVTSPKDTDCGIEEEFIKLKREGYTDKPSGEERGSLPVVQKNEGFKTSGDVQYVAYGGCADIEKMPYSGSVPVLKTILGYDYLWNNVRVKGGAYGCMSSFQRNGSCSFVSYRDPNLKSTIEVYKGLPEYIRNFSGDEMLMTKYIIGTLSDLDVPLSPSAQGARGYKVFRTHMSEEILQKERDELLNTSVEDINALADYVEDAISAGNLCVVGSEGEINRCEEIFKNVENLI